MDVKTVNFSEFKAAAVVEAHYIQTGAQYPPLPTPSYTIDGVPYWSRESMVAFGKAVERCMLQMRS